MNDLTNEVDKLNFNLKEVDEKFQIELKNHQITQEKLTIF
jgi:hypothetical protein